MKNSPTAAVSTVHGRVQHILESAQNHAARSVNTAQVVANWLIGREIVEEQQSGAKPAGYGEKVIPRLALQLRDDGVPGYGNITLKLCRQFYLAFPHLPGPGIGYAVRNQLPTPAAGQSAALVPRIIEAARAAQWQPEYLHPGLSWTHYRALLRIGKPEARAFYEIEAISQNWNARELECQSGSLLYERLAKSRDKKGLMALATKGHQIQQSADVFKDPLVIEFLGLPESHRLVESKLEEALLSNLQAFLLELGKGFAFVARQERLTLEGDHFYVDLVFYHKVLKCYVLIDLKVHKLSHQDLGQLRHRQGRNVHSKLIRSFAAPGGNLSGMSLLLSEMWEKRVELLHEIFPAVRRIGVPHNPACALDQRRQGDRMNQPQTGCMALRTTPRQSRQPVRSARAAPAVLKQACSTKARHSGFGTLKAAIRRRSVPSNWHIL